MGTDFSSFAEEDKKQKRAVIENQKQSEEKVLLGVYVTKEQKRLLKIAAANAEMSVSAFVSSAIDEKLAY